MLLNYNMLKHPKTLTHISVTVRNSGYIVESIFSCENYNYIIRYCDAYWIKQINAFHIGEDSIKLGVPKKLLDVYCNMPCNILVLCSFTFLMFANKICTAYRILDSI